MKNFMNMVAQELVRNFLPALQNLGGEKNYYSDVGSLAEILDWAIDFCQYYEKLAREHFDGRQKSFGNDVVLRSLIKSFGRGRLLSFHRQNNSSSNWFIEKYMSL
jgi:hypothetical protein